MDGEWEVKGKISCWDKLGMNRANFSDCNRIMDYYIPIALSQEDCDGWFMPLVHQPIYPLSACSLHSVTYEARQPHHHPNG